MKRFTLTIALAITTPFAAAPAMAQAAPAFEVATIKPIGPASRLLGFYAYPGGRILLGYSTVKTMIELAYDVQDFQVTGGPAWVSSDQYDVVALRSSTAETARPGQPPIRATPTPEERTMLQALLADRFGLHIRREQKDASVYLLERGTGELLLKAPRDPDGDSRGNVMTKPGGIADGEAFGQNLSMEFLTRMLSRPLGRPVLNRTGITGKYDFHLDPWDPENHDLEAAVFKAMERLGLKLKSGRGPVDTVVVEAAARPTEN